MKYNVEPASVRCVQCSSIPPSEDRTNNSIFATKIADPIPVSCGEREGERRRVGACS